MMSGAPEKLLKQGYQARREDRLTAAKAHFAEAIDLCRQADDRAMLARRSPAGQIESDLHETSAALSDYEDAVAIYRTLDDPLVLAHTVSTCGRHLRSSKANAELAARATARPSRCIAANEQPSARPGERHSRLRASPALIPASEQTPGYSGTKPEICMLPSRSRRASREPKGRLLGLTGLTRCAR